MTNYQICFTKFNTVKNNDFEYTYNDFFKKMKSLMIKDINNYGVYYKDDKYVIVYDNVSYEVRYGNLELNKDCENQDLVSRLNRLVEFSTTLSEMNKEEPKEEVIFEEKIAKTHKERLATLKREKEFYKNRTKGFLNGFICGYESVNDGKEYDGGARFVFGGIGSIIIAILSSFVSSPLIVIAFIISEVCFFDGAIKHYLFPKSDHFAGIIPFLVWLLMFLPIDIIANGSLIVGNKISYYYNTETLRKAIKEDKKIIDKYRKKFITKSKINNNEVIEYLAKMKNINSEPGNLSTTIKVISELKDSILEIKDNSLSKKYAKDLFEIISYYIDTNNNRKTLDKVYTPKLLFEQIRDLKEKVENELRKQTEKEKLNNEYSTMIENIEYQKSIGAR